LKFRFQPKSKLKNITFWNFIFLPLANLQIPFHQLWTQTSCLLISGAVDTIQTLNLQCLFYSGNLQIWTKVKSIISPVFVKVWFYVQAEELEFYGNSTGWTSLEMLFGVERLTCSLETSPTCFLLNKSLLLEEEPGLVTSRFFFFEKFDI